MTLRRLLYLTLALGAAGGAAVFADWWFCLPEGRTATYVGRQKCAECHQAEVDKWKGSFHDLAMDEATAETVLGDFNDQTFTKGDVTSRMFRRGDKFFMTTDGPTGKLQTYEIKYTFGVDPLQQYLVEFPDGAELKDGSRIPKGALQCLPIAWDTVGKRWFHLYPNEDVPAGDELHWTGPRQNWNYMCAACHSTNLQKNYDLAEHAYHTTWSEIDVSCEACHGPGSLHVELAESFGLFWDRRYGYGLPKLKGAPPKAQIETCAPCHSRHRIVYPDSPDGQPVTGEAQRFCDFRLPSLFDRDNPQITPRRVYYADGQVLDEDYVYGSFIQSKMYNNKVRCTNCHDPHTTKVKFTDNRLCGQSGCHTPALYDTPDHHFHKETAKWRVNTAGRKGNGTECVECHMPETVYMVVDPRRDHSLRVPRPDLTVTLGIPNACTGCHHDKEKGETAEWAAEKVAEWYGKEYDRSHFAYAIDAGRKGEAGADQKLAAVVNRNDYSAMVRSSALLLLRDFPDGGAGEAAAIASLEDEDPLVRATAVGYFRGRALRNNWQRLVPLLEDGTRAVRTEAAEALSAAGSSNLPEKDLAEFGNLFKENAAFHAALEELITGLKATDDQPGSHLARAVIHGNLASAHRASAFAYLKSRQRPEAQEELAQADGEIELAEREYRIALRLDPRFFPALNNLAMLYNDRGNKSEAEKYLRKALEIEPKWVHGHYSLGLLLAEDEHRLAEAVEHLETAARIDPKGARIFYNLGMAYEKLGKPEKAEAALKTAYEVAPRDEGFADYPYALADFYRKQGNPAEAEKWFRTTLKANPDLIGARYQFALMLENEQRLGEAEEQLRTVLRRAPQDPQFLLDHGRVLAKLGRKDDAAAELATARAIVGQWLLRRPDDPTLKDLLKQIDEAAAGAQENR